MAVIVSGSSYASLSVKNQLSAWAQSSSYTLTSVSYDSTYTSAIASASVAWPDGATGTFTSTNINITFGTVDSYSATYVVGGSTLHTVTQASVTRNNDGLITAQPAITVT